LSASGTTSTVAGSLSGTETIERDAPDAWIFAFNPENNYDWEAETWSVPVNVRVSELVKVTEQPVGPQAGVRYWAESPEGGLPHVCEVRSWRKSDMQSGYSSVRFRAAANLTSMTEMGR
jgi:hypothetical protein